MGRILIVLAMLTACAGEGEEAAPPRTGGPDACQQRTERCTLDQRTVEICVDGVWSPLVTCGADQVCDAAACVDCVPDCDGRVCGSDSCAGTCGTCSDDAMCTVDGRCEPVDRCGDGACTAQADENCVTCAADCGCADGFVCDPMRAECECVPQCDERQCGPDGCGGQCGDCPENTACTDGVCVGCEPDCGERECGGDGCGGLCGECRDDENCTEAGLCMSMPPACGNGMCSDTEDCATCPEDCGACCGNGACIGPENCVDCPEDCGCEEGEACDANRRACVEICIPQCDGRECGDDECEGNCGECVAGEICVEGFCEPDCVPQCDGRECGDDRCGGWCGECAEGLRCEMGACIPPDEDCGCLDDERCVDGICRGLDQRCAPAMPAGICDGSAACVAGDCVPQDGGCSLATPGGYCDALESCMDGDCEAIDDAVVCTDDAVCTADAFTGGRCRHVPIDGPCDDGNPCTQNRCAAGVCSAEPVAGCIAPGLDAHPLWTNQPRVRLSGTRRVGAQLWIGGELAAEAGESPTWSATVELALGENLIEIWTTLDGVQSEVVVARVVYDPMSPSVRVTPAGGIFLDGVTVTVVSDEPATVYYTTDGSTPDRWSQHFESMHRIRVFEDTQLRFRARDRAGNWQAEISTFDFEITGHGNGWTAGPALPDEISMAGVVQHAEATWVIGGVGANGLRDTVLRRGSGDEAWREGPPLPFARSGLAAISLGNQLHVLGGRSDGLTLNINQRLTNAGWANQAPMPTARAAIAVVGVDDMLWSFGGVTNGDRVLDVVEVYDPQTDRWRNDVPAMPRPRHGHVAAVDDGRIYLIGGEDADGEPIAAVDVFIIAENRWTQAADLPTPRSFGSVGLRENVGRLTGGDRGIVVMGGRLADGTSSPIVEELNLGTGVWRARRPLPAPRHGGGAVSLTTQDGVDGQRRIWLLGGQQNAALSATTAWYSHRQDYVAHLADLPSDRVNHVAAVLNGQIYIMGGRVTGAPRSVWRFDPETERTVEIGQLPSEQRGLTSAVVGGRLWVFGGTNSVGLASPWVRSLDPVHEAEWSDHAPMSTARAYAASVVLDNEIYLIGGANNGALQSVEIYDPAQDLWRPGPALPAGRIGAYAAVWRGAILLVGGVDAAGMPTPTMLELRDGAWQPFGVELPIAYATGARMHDAQLSLFGGQAAGDVSSQMVSLNLETRRITTPIEPADRLFSAVERAASAYLNGNLYIFGGARTTDAGRPGVAQVQKIDGRCFNGVQDPGESGDVAGDYDRGGFCPPGVPTFLGVHRRVNRDSLYGWRRCFFGAHTDRHFLEPVRAACDGEEVLLACGRTGDSRFEVVAQGQRAEIFEPDTVARLHNGAQWWHQHESIAFALDAEGRGGHDTRCDPAFNAGLCWGISAIVMGAMGPRPAFSGHRCGRRISGAGVGEWDLAIYTR